MGFKVKAHRPGPLGTQALDRIALEVDTSYVEGMSGHLTVLPLETGNGLEVLLVGDILPSRKGGRMIVRVRWDGRNPLVVFYEDGSFFEQNAVWFWSDSWIEAFQTGAFWARGGAELAKIQLEFCLGMMSGGLGWAGAIALPVIDLMQFFTSPEGVFLQHAIPKLNAAEQILLAHFPKTYKFVFEESDREMWRNIKLMAALGAARLLGRFVGIFGRAASVTRVGTAVSIASTMASFTVTRVGLARAASLKDVAATAKDLQANLMKHKVIVSQADAAGIVLEIAANPTKFQEVMTILQSIGNPYAK